MTRPTGMKNDRQSHKHEGLVDKQEKKHGSGNYNWGSLDQEADFEPHTTAEPKIKVVPQPSSASSSSGSKPAPKVETAAVEKQ